MSIAGKPCEVCARGQGVGRERRELDKRGWSLRGTERSELREGGLGGGGHP